MRLSPNALLSKYIELINAKILKTSLIWLVRVLFLPCLELYPRRQIVFFTFQILNVHFLSVLTFSSRTRLEIHFSSFFKMLRFQNITVL